MDAAFKKLQMNANAPSFVPNFSASEFVPGAPVYTAPEPAVAAVAASPPVKTTPAPAAPASRPGSEPLLTVPTPPQTVKTAPSAALGQSPAPKAPAASVPMPVELTAEELAAEEDFFAEASGQKEHFNVVFMGHVDAGKSTMCGHILLLTGMVDKRTMEKYEKEAKEQNRETWYLSWALDTNAEERAKGKTVECGRASFETENRRFTILDAPGHRNYVPSMITGASQADIGVLVISARRGEFETGFERGGQTQEHAMLAKTAGVKRLVVVINKMDDSTVEWAKERYDECVGKLLPFLKKCGYNPKTDLDFMPVSGFTGVNMKDRIPEGVCSWYSGPSLLEFLNNVTGIDRKAHGPLLMPINEKFKDMGTIVSGKIESGRIRKGQNILVMPNKKPCEVLAIYGESDEEVKTAMSGDNVRLKLKGVEEDELHSGFVLCDPRYPVKAVSAFEAQLILLEHKNIVCAGYNSVLHVHACVEEATLGSLLHLVDKKTGRKSKRPPPFVKTGQVVIARLDVAQPICIATYADHPQLGRFMLRDEGKTVAMGKVTRLIEPDEQQ